ncbi:hypothetical protein FLAN108750_02715 [Flavobacterium antarcticum]|uniref:hypothetical protein n=1 Tax=Flavobacterium antarcticum TaxID=271155 RepID=UPI0003B688C0|nr:hypothetical protein [Flavobacterium antarcticum]
MNSELKEKLENGKAAKIALNELKLAVLNESFSLAKLTKLAFDLNYQNHHKAARIVELIAEEDVFHLVDYIPQLIEIAPKYQHVSAVRGMSRILLFIILSPKISLNDLQEKEIVETALDWFITDEKVATKVNALKIMTHFCGKFPWLKSTLTELIEKEYPRQLPSYQIASRAAMAKFKR